MHTASDNPRVGILGGGQLARMLALAGAPLGIRCVQLAPQPEAAGGLVETIAAEFDDERALEDLAARADVITYESENVPVNTVRFLERIVTVHPSSDILAVASDRREEKTCFDRLGIPTAPWAAVDAADDLRAAIDRVGLPAVLKTRRLGYDGKGQLVCRSAADVDGAWQSLGAVPLICEAWVPFRREISIIIARARNGDLRWYPPAENVHVQGILRTSYAPAPDPAGDMFDLARDYVRRIVEDFDYVGVLALELFDTGDALLANEMAPRVHNTGHWTIEGAQTSQFENHLRAILGWPLGGTAPYGDWLMVNLIGSVPPTARLLAVDGTHVHLYGKAPRPGRKLGHVTLSVTSPDHARRRVAELDEAFRTG